MVERNENVGFLDRLGQTEYDRIKKREELAKEYEEFKKQDEERFKNRFADKKRFTGVTHGQLSRIKSAESMNSWTITESKVTNSAASDCEQINVQADAGTPNSNSLITADREVARNLETSALSPRVFETRISELARKIDLLYEEKQKLQNDRHSKTVSKRDKNAIIPLGSFEDSEASSSRVMQVETKPNKIESDSPNHLDSYERDLQIRLKMIRDAEERLSYIEREYMATKSSSPLKVEDTMNSILQTNGNNDKQGVSNPVRSHQTYKRPTTPQSKYRQQQLYRDELEKQIQEAKQRKLAEKRKLHEEELPKDSTDFKVERNLSSGTIITLDSYNQVKSDGDQEYFLFGQKDLLKTSPGEHVIKREINTDRLKPNYPSSESTFFHKSDSEKSANSKKEQYAKELRQQIEEARRKKELQKKMDEEFDRKIEEECAKYDPYDSSVVLNVTRPSTVAFEVSPENIAPVQTATDVNNFARGGHGIFGSPLTDEQKSNLQKYKEDLAQQIAEKKRLTELARQKEIELEKREAERIEADRIRMQKEFEEEQARRKAKQEEAEKAAEQQRRERELEKKAKLEQMKQIKEQSPPRIPLKLSKPEENVQRKNNKAKRRQEQLGSPELLIDPNPIPNRISSQIPKKDSEPVGSPIIKQLENLRSQLNMEKLKVQDALMKSKGNAEWDKLSVLETTRSHPRIVKRGAILFEENDTQNQKPTTYSDTPIRNWAAEMMKEESGTRLDKQQVACLKAQDAYLNALKEDLSLLSMKEMSNDLKLRQQHLKSINEQSINKILDLSPKNSFDLAEDKPKHMTAKSFSESSVDIEEIASKNEERLRRLEAMQLLNDIDADPEAVLQRFIEKHDELHPTKHKFPCF